MEISVSYNGNQLRPLQVVYGQHTGVLLAMGRVTFVEEKGDKTLSTEGHRQIGIKLLKVRRRFIKASLLITAKPTMIPHVGFKSEPSGDNSQF